MNDSAHDMQSALEFFRAGIFNRALEYQKVADPADKGSIIADLGLTEAVDWVLLGTQIGYFERRQALKLVLSAKESIVTAWFRLLNRQLVSPEGDLGRGVSFEGEEPVLNAALFTPEQDVDSRERDLRHDTFQTILLLTAEHIWNDEAMYFVNSIGWTDSEDWFARKNGSVLTPPRSAERIASGFADVLQYWHEVGSLGSSRFAETADRDRQSVVFVERARNVLVHRFHLDQEVVMRYFSLAGEYMNLNNDGSPAWLDARRDAFDNLILVMGNIADIRFTDILADLWNLYTHPIEVPRGQREDRTGRV
jgi:hypothetical protein